ncbi:hypothetical protein BFP70_01395 [Thioclava sp. SK-1]|uniref:hypothetical protein n=1 Tax=Thioclava sp. SK-1 TaxID=1889770 RepID=UPI00082415BC|nr:hypothetical protein [Thioclava sp. SK-1]OCX64197.1 hypothetical protein BFP70_01395 [Thioclava sp. SK-1]
MSEPNKIEIEDVLSSIRRLVSQEPTPAAPPPLQAVQPVQADDPAADDDACDTDDLLLLTPSDRVEADTADEAQPLPETEDDMTAGDLPDMAISDEDLSADTPALDDDLSQDILSPAPLVTDGETEDDALNTTEMVHEQEDIATASADILDENTLDAEWSDLHAAEPTDATDKDDTSAHSISELSADLPDSDFEPDEGDPFDIAQDTAAPTFADHEAVDDIAALAQDCPVGLSEDAAVPSPDPMALSADPEVQDVDLAAEDHDEGLGIEDTDLAEPAEGAADPEPATIEADDALTAQEDPDLHDQAWVTEHSTDTEADWSEAEAEENAPPRRLHLSDASPAAPHKGRSTTYEEMRDDDAWEDAAEAILGANATHDGEQIFNEDALRELIAQVVREELQGVLGEKITRNVRKLVRREIHRALLAHEL